MRVREAGVGDAEAIAGAHVRAWQRGYDHVFPAASLAALSVDERAARWRTNLAGETTTFVAEDGGSVLGFSSIGRNRDEDTRENVGEVFAVYVDPDAWGRGLGRELLAAAERGLAEGGFTEATLWVLDDNPRARRFYEAAGWKEDSRKLDTLLGVEVVEVRYRKVL